MRFPLEIFEAVRAAFPPAKPVGVKVSATDWVYGGWNLEQTIEYAKELKKRGADWVTAARVSLQSRSVLLHRPSRLRTSSPAVRQI